MAGTIKFKKINKIEKMKKLINLLLLILVLAVSILGIYTILKNEKNDIYDNLQILAEQAYYEGQKDALEGDIRITKTDSGYIWIKSPWNSGKTPIFQPEIQEKYVPTIPLSIENWNEYVPTDSFNINFIIKKY